jgi:predicted ATPase
MKEIIRNECSIITGGPGMGKTTLIAALQGQGYMTVPESGREIIREQVAVGGDALPWANRQEFAREMFRRDLTRFLQLPVQAGRVFFDRGFPDTIGYLELCGLDVPAEMPEAAMRYRYHTQVFLTPPWEEIYRQDAERKQSFEEAVATCNKIQEVYERLGYEVVVLPKASVAERVKIAANS